MFNEALSLADQEVHELIIAELKRQQEVLELIPSENIVSKAVLEASGSVLTNKYAEGYPSKRYYGGNEVVDKVETLAIERAKKLFGVEYVNVQPYSGSPANLAVYNALLDVNDVVLSMSLAHGGHLTHGSPVSYTSKPYSFVHYPVDEKTHLIDYDVVRKLALQHKPKLLLSGATAYPRQIDFKQMAEIAVEAGAYSMVDMSHVAGLVVSKLHPSPFPFTDVVTTTTHKTLRGPRGAVILCKPQFGKAIDKAVFPGLQGGPHEHSIAAKAVCFQEAMNSSFSEYSRQIILNAKALSQALLDHDFQLITGGTDTHLILVDLTNKGVTGKEAETALDQAGITVNKNMIPYDARTPLDPSGIRIGTPVLTSRGMKESEMKHVADLIAKVISNVSNRDNLLEVKQDVRDLTVQFPIY